LQSKTLRHVSKEAKTHENPTVASIVLTATTVEFVLNNYVRQNSVT